MASRFCDKNPIEEYMIQFTFNLALKPFEYISKRFISVIDLSDGSDAQESILDASKQINKRKHIYLWLKGGVIEREYEITCRITSNKGYIFEEKAVVRIRL